MEHESDSSTNCSWCTWNGPQSLGKKDWKNKKTGRTETIQTTALLRSVWILRKVLDIWGDLLSLRLQRMITSKHNWEKLLNYYYHYYYYYLLIRVFPISLHWWSFTGDWVTASPLKSPGLFSVFWPFSIMQLFGWSPLGRQLPNLPGPLIIL